MMVQSRYKGGICRLLPHRLPPAHLGASPIASQDCLGGVVSQHIGLVHINRSCPIAGRIDNLGALHDLRRDTGRQHVVGLQRAPLASGTNWTFLAAQSLSSQNRRDSCSPMASSSTRTFGVSIRGATTQTRHHRGGPAHVVGPSPYSPPPVSARHHRLDLDPSGRVRRVAGGAGLQRHRAGYHRRADVVAGIGRQPTRRQRHASGRHGLRHAIDNQAVVRGIEIGSPRSDGYQRSQADVNGR